MRKEDFPLKDTEDNRDELVGWAIAKWTRENPFNQPSFASSFAIISNNGHFAEVILNNCHGELAMYRASRKGMRLGT